MIDAAALGYTLTQEDADLLNEVGFFHGTPFGVEGVLRHTGPSRSWGTQRMESFGGLYVTSGKAQAEGYARPRLSDSNMAFELGLEVRPTVYRILFREGMVVSLDEDHFGWGALQFEAPEDVEEWPRMYFSEAESDLIEDAPWMTPDAALENRLDHDPAGLRYLYDSLFDISRAHVSGEIDRAGAIRELTEVGALVLPSILSGWDFHLDLEHDSWVALRVLAGPLVGSAVGEYVARTWRPLQAGGALGNTVGSLHSPDIKVQWEAVPWADAQEVTVAHTKYPDTFVIAVLASDVSELAAADVDMERTREWLSGGPLAYVRSIQVDPHVQGLGIADQLLTRVLLELVRAGASTTWVIASPPDFDQRARFFGWLERHGFELVDPVLGLMRRQGV